MKRIIVVKNGEKILIRSLKKSDIEGVWANFNEVVDEGIYLPVFKPVKSEYEKKNWYETIINRKEVCIVAEHLDIKEPYNIIGQCEISNSEWEAALHIGILGLIVKKKYRDLGIGKNLVDTAIKTSSKLNNKKKIILSCYSTNERAIYLYKKMGFKIVGVRKKQFYLDSIYYDEVLMDLWIDDYLNKEKIP